MFSCFGIKGSGDHRDRKMTSNDIRNLKLEVGNNVLMLNMYEKLVREYQSGRKESVVFVKEGNIIKNTIEAVLMKIKLAETNISEIKNEIEKLTRAEELREKLFQLKNIFIMRDSEIDNFEAYIQKISGLDNIELERFDNPTNDTLLKYVSEIRARYSDLTKETITVKNNINKILNKIKNLSEEAEMIKNPKKIQSVEESNVDITNELEKNKAKISHLTQIITDQKAKMNKIENENIELVKILNSKYSMISYLEKKLKK